MKLVTRPGVGELENVLEDLEGVLPDVDGVVEGSPTQELDEGVG